MTRGKKYFNITKTQGGSAKAEKAWVFIWSYPKCAFEIDFSNRAFGVIPCRFIENTQNILTQIKIGGDYGFW